MYKSLVIEGLDFSTRVRNRLALGNFLTVMDLLSSNEEEVLNIKQLGDLGIIEVRDKLAFLGYSLLPTFEAQLESLLFLLDHLDEDYLETRLDALRLSDLSLGVLEQDDCEILGDLRKYRNVKFDWGHAMRYALGHIRAALL